MKICPRPRSFVDSQVDLAKGALERFVLPPSSARGGALGNDFCQVPPDHTRESRIALDRDFPYFLHQFGPQEIV
jgi:hypothetical protein